MKVKSLVSITLLASTLIGSLASVLSVSAQGSAPPLAPSRLLRSSNSSAGSSANSSSSLSSASSFNGSVLNGSVINNSTIGGASRLLRPATPPALGSSSKSLTPSFASSPGNSASLFSADEQAAFSQVRQTQPLQQVSPAIVAPSSYGSSANIQTVNSSSSSGSSNQSKFDIGQALRLGAQFVNAINAGSNNRVSSASSSGQFSSSATTTASSNLLKNSLKKPAFVSKFARPLTSSELTVLSKYDVVIVLDKSGSMEERDCPGGMSRWDWCRDQMMSLTAQISSVFKNGITVALYSSDYDIFRNVDLSYVTRIFGENGPSGGTYTGKVMDAVFDDYFARRANNPATRKLLVQVVTDGDPSDKGALIAAISRASQMINSPGEITVNFLQIGHEEAGARTLAKLDSNMASEGAKFDIVRVEPFAAVEREGLPRALADAIN